MPDDFNPENHPLERLKVTTLNGVVFASFDARVETLAKYLGESMLGYFERVFDGRKLTVLGYSRQIIPCNWMTSSGPDAEPYGDEEPRSG